MFVGYGVNALSNLRSDVTRPRHIRQYKSKSKTIQQIVHPILTGYHTGFAGIDLRSIKQTLVSRFGRDSWDVFQQHHQQLTFDL